MRIIHYLPRRYASAGNSLIEIAVILPILLVLVLGVVDFSRAILFNNILVNMSREGANLSRRSTYDKQIIITSLSNTADPLVMNATSAKRIPHGMIYITYIKGVVLNGVLSSVVQDQYRTSDGDTTLTSKMWTGCAHWDLTGKCDTLPAVASRVVTLPPPITLPSGSDVYFVETIYDYIPFTNYVMKNSIDLYSSTLL